MIGHYSILMNAPIVLFLMMISSAMLAPANQYEKLLHMKWPFGVCVYVHIYASFEKGVFLTDSPCFARRSCYCMVVVVFMLILHK